MRWGYEELQRDRVSLVNPDHHAGGDDRLLMLAADRIRRFAVIRSPDAHDCFWQKWLFQGQRLDDRRRT
jgi:hypothetical protein